MIPNAVSVWIDGLMVGYLPERGELPRARGPDCLRRRSALGKPVALEGIVGAGS